jgi:signal peptidase II
VRAARPGLGRAGIVALAAVALDQITKAWARGAVAPGETIDLFLGIDIVRVANRGIAFGLLDDLGSAVIIIAAVAFAVLLLLFLVGADRPGLWLPIGLLAGGATGNLIDRLRDGYVTDFIDPPRWPAFNLADVEITAGVIILLAIYTLGIGEEGEPVPEGAEGPSSAERR